MFEELRRTRLQRKLENLKNEINNLKTKLNDINKNKEEWFAKKESLKEEIKQLIERSQKIKLQKNTMNEDIANLKQKRDEYNSVVGILIKKAQELNKQRKETFKDSNKLLTPYKIKSKIESLEQQIETEVLPLKKEEKLMKEIRDLRQAQTRNLELDKILENIGLLSKEITESKNKADDFHNKLKEHSQLKQQGYTEFITLSKSINEKKVEQEKAFRKFLRLKRAFLETNKELKERLTKINKIRTKIDKLSPKEQKLEAKSKEVEEKIKQKKKLTKDDLLVFQSKNK